MSLEDNNKLAFVGLLNSVSDSLGRALTEKKTRAIGQWIGQ